MTESNKRKSSSLSKDQFCSEVFRETTCPRQSRETELNVQGAFSFILMVIFLLSSSLTDNAVSLSIRPDPHSGMPGIPGVPGMPGTPGSPGRDCFKGEKGIIGKRGSQGAIGLPWKIGPRSPEGSEGEIGSIGIKGMLDTAFVVTYFQAADRVGCNL
ncbi:complement C1q subcomponent subunit B-like [Orbicella faveolata]|uniref:complement C1q subcomponent subunit B-like n=1 Tax=Orbicella faveolata TaxID=48498 RepID=UPI0009E31B7E|nr:complement C1q subcomponent subunit B-like [Orbicella faveolata]